ncbi:MAG: hypothetical protein ACRD4Q_02455 [Candidatus Acidiferrales bacterium]
MSTINDVAAARQETTGGACAPVMDEEIEVRIEDWRKQYRAGTLPDWQRKRIERIPGWTWEEAAHA